MRRSTYMKQVVRNHAVVLHRIQCLLREGDTKEARERLDYVEALCIDTLETIAELRAQDFVQTVEKDIKGLPMTRKV